MRNNFLNDEEESVTKLNYDKLVPYHAMSFLSQRAKHSKLSKKFYADKDVCAALECVRKVMPLNEEQIILFSIISAYTIGKDSSTMQMIGDTLSLPPFELLELQDDIDNMLVSNLVDYKYDGLEVGLAANMDVLKDLHDNKSNVMPGSVKMKGNLDFVHFIARKITQKGYPMKVLNKFCKKIPEMYENIDIIKRMTEKGLDEQERNIVFVLLDSFVCTEHFISVSELDEILTNKRNYEYIAVRRYVMNPKNLLIEKKYIKVVPAMYVDNSAVFVTEKAIADFLPEEKKQIKKVAIPEFDCRENKCTIIKTKDIYKKELVYDDKTREQIQTLHDILSPKGFRRIQTNLNKMGLNSGINVLLYGYPGTGKTETVLQLCKESGRNVMQVNISEMKSCFYGNSESIVDDLFKHYQEYAKNMNIAPVLLFNEADGILSKRKQLNDSNTVGQTENAIQNIILQRMETNKGIIICTTNMIKNLDEAFDRRFLYKIEFSKPDVATKAKLVKLKLGQYLSDDECLKLARDYHLTGGTLDNILTKIVAKQCLYSSCPTYNDINLYCQQDVMSKPITPIGF